jgi:hypothetical protein
MAGRTSDYTVGGLKTTGICSIIVLEAGHKCEIKAWVGLSPSEGSHGDFQPLPASDGSRLLLACGRIPHDFASDFT